MADPNGLDLRGNPGGRRMARWPVYAVVAVGFCLVGALVYGLQVNDPSRRQEEKKTEIPVNENVGRAPLLPEDNAHAGLVTPPPTPPAQQPAPLLVVQKEKLPPVDPRVENIRRAKSQSYQTALAAPLVVRRFGENTSAPAASPAVAERRAPDRERVSASDSDYDPAADRDKEAFFERANRDTSWQLAQQRTEGMPYEIKTGAVIPAVMVTGINSDLPGNMIAQVARNVYDSATGRFLLIPQGAKLYGVYDSRVVYGQQRVLIAWNRIIFPDGSSMSIGAMPGADMAGMAGFSDEVDNHYLRIFGSAVLMSLVTGGMAYAMDSANSNVGSTDNGTSMQDEMTSALAAQLGQTTTTLLQKNLNIKPTLEVRPGYQFNIVVTKDLVFRQPYQAWGR